MATRPRDVRRRLREKLLRAVARTSPRDPGLQQIDDLERDIVLGKEQLWTWNGVSAEEIARFLPDVRAVAKAACDQLRSEYLQRLARIQQP